MGMIPYLSAILGAREIEAWDRPLLMNMKKQLELFTKNKYYDVHCAKPNRESFTLCPNFGKWRPRWALVQTIPVEFMKLGNLLLGDRIHPARVSINPCPQSISIRLTIHILSSLR